MSLKILSVGSDKNLFEENSAVSERIKKQGSLVEELHIIVFAEKHLGLQNKQLDKNIWIYPTNSSLKILRHEDAIKIGSKIIKEHHFVRGRSVVTAQDPFLCGLAALKIKKKFRLPMEIQLHTDPFSPHYTGLGNGLRKHIAEKVLKQADSIRVVSESLKSLLSTTYSLSSTNINVLPIYIDTERIKDGKVSFDLHARLGWNFILLSVARLAPEKNLGLAIETLARVREYFPDTGLVIVGSGPEEDNLRKLATKLGVEKNVEFAGWQEDLTSYYKSANIFIQTSNFEGYGMALVEAGLSNLPVVTTNVGLAQELENGVDAFITPVGDKELMFRAVYDLVKDGTKREMLKVNLKQTLEHKLLSKEDYLNKIKENWEKTALKIQ